MQDYLVTLLVVSAATAIMGALPQGEKMKKAVGFALSLLVLSAVVLPLPTLLDGLPSDYSSILSELEGGAAEGEDYLTALTLHAVGEGMADHLAERYSLARREIAVTVEGEIVSGTVILRSVTVLLAGGAITADAPSLIRYIEAECGADCEVIYLEE